MYSALQKWFLILYIAVSCVVVSGAAWFVKITLDGHSSLKTLRAEQILNEQQSARAAETRLALRETQQVRTHLFAITGTTGAVDIIDAIEEVASSVRVDAKVESASPGNPHPKDKTLASYTFSVRARGTYDRVSHFLQLLITLPGPITVDRFSLQQQEKEWEGFITFTEYVAPRDVLTPTSTP